MKSKERRSHPRHDVETPAEITVAEPKEGGDPADQRSHERVNVSYEINIEAGLNIRGQEVMRLTLTGKTIDISLGGMLIRVDQDVIPGARCDVRFTNARGQIEPENIWGRVRRSTAAGKGFELAVQFESPLELLQV
jgi:hypothetical protein